MMYSKYFCGVFALVAGSVLLSGVLLRPGEVVTENALVALKLTDCVADDEFEDVCAVRLAMADASDRTLTCKLQEEGDVEELGCCDGLKANEEIESSAETCNDDCLAAFGDEWHADGGAWVMSVFGEWQPEEDKCVCRDLMCLVEDIEDIAKAKERVEKSLASVRLKSDDAEICGSEQQLAEHLSEDGSLEKARKEMLRSELRLLSDAYVSDCPHTISVRFVSDGFLTATKAQELVDYMTAVYDGSNKLWMTEARDSVQAFDVTFTVAARDTQANLDELCKTTDRGVKLVAVSPTTQLNVFICDGLQDSYGDALAGVAILPWSSYANTVKDMILMDKNYLLQSDYAFALSHEVGHSLGLWHTFKDYSCYGTGDDVSDTPAVSSYDYSCYDWNGACDSFRMAQNAMDYSLGCFRYAITEGQLARIQSYAVNGGPRAGLWVADVPIGEEMTGNGADYTGTQTKARNGMTCVDWYWGGLSGHNHCRNPNGFETIWCLVDTDYHYAFCDQRAC